MPYISANGRLPSESASKLGHLAVIESDWVRSLIEDFESKEDIKEADGNLGEWETIEKNGQNELKNIWSVDGSFMKVESGRYPKKEVAFVKTALLMLDNEKLKNIDKNNPHPLQMKKLMEDTAIFHATVFPLNNIRTSKGNNYDTIRNIIFESVKIEQNGAFYETLKWLVYEKWNDKKINSPEFQCPNCNNIVKEGFAHNSDKMMCPLCGEEVFLTDMLGFHLDMLEESAPEVIASAYMSIMETLMLFTPIRILWDYSDKKVLSDTLFIKDGPLSLFSQYSKLVPKIRNFLQYAKEKNRNVHIIGCEKSGKFFEHLSTIHKNILLEDNQIKYKVLTHKYVIDEVQRRNFNNNQYGARTNWGEKVYVKVDNGTYMVLNIPTGNYNFDDNFPLKRDIIGLEKILNTIPSLISRKYEGALFPVELVNGIASMSSYPSAKVLERYTEDKMKKEVETIYTY